MIHIFKIKLNSVLKIKCTCFTYNGVFFVVILLTTNTEIGPKKKL